MMEKGIGRHGVMEDGSFGRSLGRRRGWVRGRWWGRRGGGGPGGGGEEDGGMREGGLEVVGVWGGTA